MHIRLNRLAGGLCAILVSVPLAGKPQTRHISGSVHDGNDQGVAQTEVRIDGAGADTTTDSGEFKFPFLPPLKVGFAVTFRVKGWVIIDPCMRARGRIYLPDPDAETVSITVLRPGDRGLLSGHSIGCIVEEEATHFEAKPASAQSPRSSLQDEMVPTFAGRGEPEAPGVRTSSPGTARIVAAAYRMDFFPSPSATLSPPGSEKTPPEASSFLASQAKELGFTAEQLTAAMDQWARTTEDVYQKGLAALYERRYPEASEFISASIPSPPGRFVERYVPLARAEYEQGHYTAAESGLRKVLAIHEDDPVILNLLGLVLAAQARYADSEPFYKRALEVDRGIHGPDHPDVAAIIGNLANLYRTQHRYAEAEPLYEQALKIQKQALGPDDPDVATSLNGLALVYHAQGRDAEAIELYEQAAAIDGKAMDSEPPQDVAATLCNLADLYRAHAMYERAEVLLKRAEEIVLKGLGPQHPAVARVENFWGLLYHSEGKESDAASTYMLALAIAKHALGPEHPFVATILDNLGEVYRTEGEYSDAEPLYQQALEIAKKTEPDQLEMGTYLNHLAVLYHAQGDYPKAESFYRQALAIDEKLMKPDDPDLAVALGNVGLIYKDEEKYADAEPLLRSALAINEKVLGPDDRALFANLEVLAYTLSRLNRPREAKVYEDRMKRILLNVQAFQAHEKGDDARAESLYRSAVASAEKSSGPRDPEVARELSNLGVVLHAEGKDAEAESALQRALAVQEGALGPQDPKVATILENLASVLGKLGRDAEAKTYKERAARIRANLKQQSSAGIQKPE